MTVVITLLVNYYCKTVRCTLVYCKLIVIQQDKVFLIQLGGHWSLRTG